jgi:Fe-S-cluster containining protein
MFGRLSRHDRLKPPPLTDAEPLPFEGVLANFTQEAHPLSAAMEAARIDLPQVSNMGGTGDERDLFTVTDRLADAVKEAYPESLCGAGCSACCHYPVGLFDIDRAEWDVIRRYLQTAWTREQRRDFHARFLERFGPYRLKLWLLNVMMTFPLPVTSRPEGLPLACPFLVNNRCSVYPARPIVCRTFGLFSVRRSGRQESHLYACEMQATALNEALTGDGPQIMPPSVNPIRLVLVRFLKNKSKLLPMWLWKDFPLD